MRTIINTVFSGWFLFAVSAVLIGLVIGRCL